MDEDLVCIATYLRRENPRAAKRFLDVAFETFAFITNWPEAAPLARLGAHRHRLIRCRALGPPFQNYLVFYLCQGNEVRILRVLHSASNWQADLELFG